jgi:hypothetical protein
MIPATNAAALGPMLASRYQGHGKPMRGQPDAKRLTSGQGSGNGALYQRPRYPTGAACEAFPLRRGDG